MTLVWRPGFQFDDDASTYIEAVEAADTQALETGVRYAINDFVIGCKNDGIWDAIKASCILAGARTLDGAFVPLVGTAPTNYNFLAGDYDRKTGLVGDGSTKYLDSNRNNNADPQNNQHLSFFASTVGSSLTGYIGSGAGATAGISQLYVTSGNNIDTRSQSSALGGTFSNVAGFSGLSRAASDLYTVRVNNNNNAASTNSQVPNNAIIEIFHLPGLASYYSNARLAFYSIGEALDLAALDTRVSDLITAIGAAIP